MSEWISVKDQMPPLEERPEGSDPFLEYVHTIDVRGLLDNGDQIDVYHDGDRWCYSDLSGGPYIRQVIYWKPIE